jgi:topoisomerase-4 subunit A
MEIKAEDKRLRAERTQIKALLGSAKEQWKTVGAQIKDIRDKFGPKTALGKRRTTFAEAPEHDLAAIEEAMVVREPVTVVVSEKGWIRALRGHVSDLSGVTFKAGDKLQFAFPTETIAKVLLFASNGRFYMIDVSKLPGGRGFGEPIRIYVDIEQDAVVVAAMAFTGGRKFLVASHAGNGFIVAENECTANTRKGKQVLNLKNDRACALAPVDGDLVASIGENRKMVIFPIGDIPEMTRGRGVRLQRYKEKGLADVTTFGAENGLTWVDSAGRSFTLTLKELRDWRGKRADAGRLAPKGFPKSNRFSPAAVASGPAESNSDED